MIIVMMIMRIIIIMMIIMMMIIMIIIKRFPAHDELGTCRTNLAFPEQPVSCIPVHEQNPAIKSGVKH